MYIYFFYLMKGVPAWLGVGRSCCDVLQLGYILFKGGHKVTMETEIGTLRNPRVQVRSSP